MSVRIVDVREITKQISSPIRNAYIDFTKMTTSLVAVVTDVKRDGKTVVGYGFNSNGRYGQGGLIRERFAPRILEADPKSLLDTGGDNLDPAEVRPRHQGQHLHLVASLLGSSNYMRHQRPGAGEQRQAAAH